MSEMEKNIDKSRRLGRALMGVRALSRFRIKPRFAGAGEQIGDGRLSREPRGVNRKGGEARGGATDYVA